MSEAKTCFHCKKVLTKEDEYHYDRICNDCEGQHTYDTHSEALKKEIESLKGLIATRDFEIRILQERIDDLESKAPKEDNKEELNE
jgi:hypothetical protein